MSITCASATSTVVGEIAWHTAEDARRACLLSERAYLSGEWPKVSGTVRSSLLLRTATLLLLKRNQLAALLFYEAGKAIPEACADVDEAIDFLNFYGGRSEDAPPSGQGFRGKSWAGGCHHPLEFSPGHSRRDDRRSPGGGQYRV